MTTTPAQGRASRRKGIAEHSRTTKTDTTHDQSRERRLHPACQHPEENKP